MPQRREDLLDWRAIGEVDDVTSERLLKDPGIRKRCLQSRMVFKHRGDGKGCVDVRALVQCCVQSCDDPCFSWLRRNVATTTIGSCLLFSTVLVSWWRQQFEVWRCFVGDVARAFFQGQQAGEREQGLRMRPPTDMTSRFAGVFNAKLYRVVGNIYG